MLGKSRRPRGGFTLVELLVALTILTIIIAVIYGAYAAVVDSIQDTREASQRLRTRQFIQRSLARNLGQASEGWSPGAAYRTFAPSGGQSSAGDGAGRGIMRYPFMGARETTANGPADTVTFVSSAPMIGSSAYPGAMKLCTYRVVEEEGEDFDAGGEKRMLLTVTESFWVDPGLGAEQRFTGPAQTTELVQRAGELAGLEPKTVSIPIYAWELAYYDGKDWVDTWDAQELGRLPWSVRVRLKVTSPADDGFVKSSSLDPEEDPEVVEIHVTVPAGSGVFDAPPDYVRPTDRTAT